MGKNYLPLFWNLNYLRLTWARPVSNKLSSSPSTITPFRFISTGHQAWLWIPTSSLPWVLCLPCRHSNVEASHWLKCLESNSEHCQSTLDNDADIKVNTVQAPGGNELNVICASHGVLGCTVGLFLLMLVQQRTIGNSLAEVLFFVAYAWLHYREWCGESGNLVIYQVGRKSVSHC